MSDNSFVIDKDNLEVRITRIFSATPERMWKAFTDSEEIPKWWADTRVDEQDVKVGGKWRYVSDGEDGKEHVFYGIFKEIDEPRKIVRTFEYEPYAGHVLTESITFKSQPDGKTKMVNVSRYDNIGDLEGMVGSGMERGATAGLDRLAKLVEQR
jgi:uncharacterized protein YndB with AHSA1/START domain